MGPAFYFERETEADRQTKRSARKGGLNTQFGARTGQGERERNLVICGVFSLQLKLKICYEQGTI